MSVVDELRLSESAARILAFAVEGSVVKFVEKSIWLSIHRTSETVHSPALCAADMMAALRQNIGPVGNRQNIGHMHYLLETNMKRKTAPEAPEPEQAWFGTAAYPHHADRDHITWPHLNSDIRRTVVQRLIRRGGVIVFTGILFDVLEILWRRIGVFTCLLLSSACIEFCEPDSDFLKAAALHDEAEYELSETESDTEGIEHVIENSKPGPAESESDSDSENEPGIAQLLYETAAGVKISRSSVHLTSHAVNAAVSRLVAD